MYNNYLIDFKDLYISKEELSNKLGGNLLSVKIDNPVVIYSTDVINLLNAYKKRQITIEYLINWVNTIWFTDLFDYYDEQCDSIASVLNKLEELDEKDKELTEDDVNNYINALQNNNEI